MTHVVQPTNAGQVSRRDFLAGGRGAGKPRLTKGSVVPLTQSSLPNYNKRCSMVRKNAPTNRCAIVLRYSRLLYLAKRCAERRSNDRYALAILQAIAERPRPHRYTRLHSRDDVCAACDF
jgi:hypothetical protein